MITFLEGFIPYWIYTQLVIILIFTISLLYHYRLVIKKEVLDNTNNYIILGIIFVIGTFIRFYNLINKYFIINDQLYYLIDGTRISELGRYIFVRKLPTFPTLISVFDIFNFNNISPGSFINGLFGSLTIIAIFVMVYLITKKRMPALISAIIIAFFPFHIRLSTIGEPFITSIFFLMLTTIFFILANKTENNIFYIISGLTLGISCQIYTLEIFLLIILIIYTIIFFNFKKLFNKKFIIFVLMIMLSITPFLILQQNVSEETISWVDFGEEDSYSKLLCQYSRIGCGYIQPKYLIKNSNKGYPLNNLEGGLLSYSSYYFLGIGTYNNKDFNYVFQEQTIYSNKIQWQYLILGLAAISSLFINDYKKDKNNKKNIKDKNKNKKVEIFFILSILSSIIFFGLNYFRVSYYPIYTYSLLLIPLAAIGIDKVFNVIFNKKNIRTILKLCFVMLLLASLNYNEGNLDKLDRYSFRNNLSTYQENNISPICYDFNCDFDSNETELEPFPNSPDELITMTNTYVKLTKYYNDLTNLNIKNKSQLIEGSYITK